MNEPLRMTARDAGMSITFTYIPGEQSNQVVQLIALDISLHTPEKAAEFTTLMQRALNTSEPSATPEWATFIMDFVTGTPAPKKRPETVLLG